MTHLRPLIAAVVLVIVAVCASVIGARMPADRTAPYRAPDAEHLLGTDSLGKDVLRQLLLHAPTTFVVPALATVMLAVLGSLLGVLLGLAPQRLRNLMLRAGDVVLIIPPIVLTLVVVLGFGATPTAIVIAVVLAGLVMFVRVLASATAQISHSGYVEAAFGFGDTPLRIAVRDILPGLFGVVIAETTLRFLTAIQLVAALSFLGLASGLGNSWARHPGQHHWLLPQSMGNPGARPHPGRLGRTDRLRGRTRHPRPRSTARTAGGVEEPMTPLLACRGLSISAPDGRPLFEGLNLELHPGTRVAIMGPSGSGKTTLLRAILHDPAPGFTHTGRVTVAGEEHRTGTRRVRIADTIAHLPQDAAASLTPTMRIGALLREAVLTGSGAPRQIIEEVLGTVRLPHGADFLRRRPWQLSGGQQRRVAMARALARQRPVLVLDEPTAGLDPDTRGQVLDLLAHLSTQLSCALLLVTHDLAAAEALHCETHRLGDPPQPATVWSAPRQNTLSSTTLSLREATILDAGGGVVSPRLTLDLRAGELTALRGASGSGKTTIARTLAGYLPPRSGTVTLLGSRIAGALRDRTIAQRRAIQLVMQNADDAFQPRRTLRQAVSAARPAVDPSSLLTQVGLPAELLDRLPHELSGGQRQRFALVRALSVQPAVLLLDEPTSALDPETAWQVFATIRRAAEAGTSVLFITHDDAFGTEHFDRNLTLIDGEVTSTAG